jgi:hypothetical protein
MRGRQFLSLQWPTDLFVGAHLDRITLDHGVEGCEGIEGTTTLRAEGLSTESLIQSIEHLASLPRVTKASLTWEPPVGTPFRGGSLHVTLSLWADARTWFYLSQSVWYKDDLRENYLSQTLAAETGVSSDDQLACIRKALASYQDTNRLMLDTGNRLSFDLRTGKIIKTRAPLSEASPSKRSRGRPPGRKT